MKLTYCRVEQLAISIMTVDVKLIMKTSHILLRWGKY